MHHKNEVRNAVSVQLTQAYESNMHGSFVNNDTLACRTLHSMQQRCADCGRVGLRMQIRSNCWIRGLTANGFFLFRGRDVAITMNSVKILHAVQSAFTAIAELLVSACEWTWNSTEQIWNILELFYFSFVTHMWTSETKLFYYGRPQLAGRRPY